MKTVAHEWSVWSTRARVCVTDPTKLDEAVARVRALLHLIDEAASRFRPDSEIRTLSTDAHGNVDAELSPLLADLVRASLDTARRTAGAVDPTVARALVDLGYDRTFPLVPTRHDTVVTVPAPGWHSVTLDDRRLRMPAHVHLDLGASAKAVAADRAATLVRDTLGCGALVSLGGDIATAGRGPFGGWQVTVRDRQDEPADKITLAGGWAVATSSTTRRTWERGGRSMHHIIDPVTGAPTSGAWRTVTVAARTCLGANAATTATIVKGRTGLGWLRNQGFAARLVDQDGHVHRLGGWPQEKAVA